MNVLQHSALPVDAPSPPVGEGISAAQPEFVWVRRLLPAFDVETTPHPPPLRVGTLSHKGRG